MKQALLHASPPRLTRHLASPVGDRPLRPESRRFRMVTQTALPGKAARNSSDGPLLLVGQGLDREREWGGQY